MRNLLVISIMAVLLAAIVNPGRTEERQSSVTVYTSPEINLGEINREIIDQVGAGGHINFAAFVLSDYAIIDALRSAALRGAIKVKCHLMFGIVVLAADQILRVASFRPAPA